MPVSGNSAPWNGLHLGVCKSLSLGNKVTSLEKISLRAVGSHAGLNTHVPRGWFASCSDDLPCLQGRTQPHNPVLSIWKYLWESCQLWGIWSRVGWYSGEFALSSSFPYPCSRSSSPPVSTTVLSELILHSVLLGQFFPPRTLKGPSLASRQS